MSPLNKRKSNIFYVMQNVTFAITNTVRKAKNNPPTPAEFPQVLCTHPIPSGKNSFGKELLKLKLTLQGRVVRKPVNANPGLKFNWGNNFSCIKALSIAYILCCLRLLVFDTEGQKM